jgi:hypothetical protein
MEALILTHDDPLINKCSNYDDPDDMYCKNGDPDI